MSRIAVLARELEGARRGVGRWLAEVLAEIASIGRADEFTLFSEGPLEVPGFRVVATGPGPGGGSTAWEQFRLPSALATARPKVVFGPAYSLPVLSRTPSVVAMHDLSFEAHPEWFSFSEGFRRRTLARWASARARSILVLSRFGANELVRRYEVAPARIKLVGAGVSPRFQPQRDPGRVLADPGRVILSVGSLFNRRRPAELISGFGLAARSHPDLRLVIVGDDRTYPPLDLKGLCREAGIERQTTWLERVSEDDLIALYSQAEVVVYFSDYEGLGLPPLEALGCGARVLASSAPALAETLTGRATLLAQVSAQDVADALGSLLAAPIAPRERPGWLAEFSWRKTAMRVLEALDEAAR